MSVTYYAKAIIGLKIPREKLYREEVFQHRHHESSGRGNMYCSKCGERLPEAGQTGMVPVWSENDNEEPVIGRWPLILGPSQRDDTVEWAIVPDLVATKTEFAWHNSPVESIDLLSGGYDVWAAARAMQEALEPLGLWDSKAFGLHAVLEAG